ncbi:MAG: BamA/TamA family outer membrane protein [Deltaproteobacteria bacterium]|nr:BamA/TamA family outer membrane protein [Deltaproteobacteria bacterium]
MLRTAAAVALACAVAGPAVAETPPERGESAPGIPTERPNTGEMRSDDLARKNVGGYFTGLPILVYSTDIGLGVGARVYYYWNGDRTDPRFTRSPYLYRMFVQAFGSTRGLQFHYLDFDAPQINHTPYRVRSELVFMRNITSNYFSLGNKSLAPLAFTGSPQTFTSFDAYNHELQRIAGDGTTFAKYDQFDLIRPYLLGSVQRDFKKVLRVQAGLGFSYAQIRDYTGTRVDATDAGGQAATATQSPTRLREECAAGIVVGCDGGWDNFFRLALSYDSRDFEPDPNLGMFLEVAIDAASAALGSEYDYVRGIVAGRGYWSPIPGRDFVLAGRAAVVASTPGVPFFSMDTFPFTETPRTGLGGHRTLRGFRQDRFVGPVMTLANLEARWTFGHTQIKQQRFAFILAPFIDVGRPFDKLAELTWRDWRRSYGAAFRVSWNLATIVTADFGVSAEDAGFYLNFGHMF